MNLNKTTIENLNEINYLVENKRYSESLWEIENTCVDYMNCLGLLYFNTMRDLKKSVKCFHSCLNIQPSNWRIHNNLAHVYDESKDYDNALLHAMQSVKFCTEDDVDPHYNMGVILMNLGRLEESIPMYRAALKCSDNEEMTKKINYNLALALIRTKKYEEGWKLYEYRFFQNPSLLRFKERFQVPYWNNEDLKGKTIYVFNEQGIGDFINFCRFLPELKAKGCKIILEVQDPLVKLVEKYCTFDELVMRPNDLSVPDPANKPFDFCISVNSLPGLFGCTDKNACNKPYMGRAKKTKKIKKIGVCWAGNPSHQKDFARSIPLEIFGNIVVPGFEWHSLQKNYQVQGIIDKTGPVKDMYDMSELIKEVDLVITVDTAVAHLAGAMGKKVWMLTSIICDFRWGFSDSTFWYPNMRIFRQSKFGNWMPVIEQIKTELASLQT